MTNASYIASSNIVKPETSHLSVYPNPAQNVIQTNFETIRRGLVVIELFSLDGKVVDTFLNESLPAGKHTITLNLDKGKIGRGLYILRVLSAEFNDTQKLFID